MSQNILWIGNKSTQNYDAINAINQNSKQIKLIIEKDPEVILERIKTIKVVILFDEEVLFDSIALLESIMINGQNILLYYITTNESRPVKQTFAIIKGAKDVFHFPKELPKLLMALNNITTEIKISKKTNVSKVEISKDILILEDQQYHLLFIKKLCEKWNFSPTWIESPSFESVKIYFDTIKKTNKKYPDVIIIDLSWSKKDDDFFINCRNKNLKTSEKNLPDVFKFFAYLENLNVFLPKIIFTRYSSQINEVFESSFLQFKDDYFLFQKPEDRITVSEITDEILSEKWAINLKWAIGKCILAKAFFEQLENNFDKKYVRRPKIENIEYYATLMKAAQSRDPILLLGPSGSGKTTLAKAIGQVSYRKDNFISVDVGTITGRPTFSSTMFGVEAGAFTDAIKRPGYLEKSDGGILFLDEIANLSLNDQIQLYEVINNDSKIPIKRVGSTETKFLDIKFIFATNQNINQLLTSGNIHTPFLSRLMNSSIILTKPIDKEELNLLITNLFDIKIAEEKNIFNGEFITPNIKKTLFHDFDKLLLLPIWDDLRKYDRLVRTAYTNNTSLLETYNLLNSQTKPINFINHIIKEEECVNNEQTQKIFDNNSIGSVSLNVLELIKTKKVSINDLFQEIEKYIYFHLKNNNHNRKEISDVLQIKEKTLDTHISKFNQNN